MPGFDYLVSDVGEPVVPQGVLDALRAIDARLGCKWHPGLASFAITLRWAEDAPQRELIRRGELPPDNDHSIIAWLPPSVPLDEAPGFVTQAVALAGMTHPEVRRVLEAREREVARRNEAVLDRAAATVLDEVAAEASDGTTVKVGRRRTRVTPPAA